MFEQIRESFRSMLADATAPGERRAVLGEMKETLVRARLGVDDLRERLRAELPGGLRGQVTGGPAFRADIGVTRTSCNGIWPPACLPPEKTLTVGRGSASSPAAPANPAKCR